MECFYYGFVTGLTIVSRTRFGSDFSLWTSRQTDRQGHADSILRESIYACGFASLLAAAIAWESDAETRFSFGFAIDLQDRTVLDRRLLDDSKTQARSGNLGRDAWSPVVTFGNPRQVLRFDSSALIGDRENVLAECIDIPGY